VNSVRATLMGNSRITGIIKAWKGDQVTLTSPIFGEATFDASIFRQVQFNLGKPRSASSNPSNSSVNFQSDSPGNVDIIVKRLQELQGRKRAIPRKR
jgi:hypothetical protein